MISDSFKYMFRDENWKTKLAIGGLVSIIPIFNFLLYGYMIDIMKLIYNGVDDKLPEFKIIAQLIEGIYGLIIVFVYISIPTIILVGYLLIMGASISLVSNTEGLSTIIALISVVIMILFIIVFVIFALATPIVLSHYAYTNKLSSIFEFKTIFKILKKTWLDILIFNIVLYIAIMILEVVISVIAFLCTMTIILIPVAIWIAGMFLYYIYTVMGYAYGRIYLKGITE
jgi:hypothetical protein